MSESSHSRYFLLVSGLGATLASLCCLGPLLLLALGFSGAWLANLTALEPYRPFLWGYRCSRCCSPDNASSGRRPLARPANLAHHRYNVNGASPCFGWYRR